MVLATASELCPPQFRLGVHDVQSILKATVNIQDWLVLAEVVVPYFSMIWST